MKTKRVIHWRYLPYEPIRRNALAPVAWCFLISHAIALSAQVLLEF